MSIRMKLASYVDAHGNKVIIEASRHFELLGVRGVKAGGYCLDCGNPVALKHYTEKRRGHLVTDHYVHLPSAPCKDQVSCDVHKRSLEVVRAAVHAGRAFHWPGGGEFIPVKVLADRSFKEIRPDIVLVDAENRMIFVEIRVTHAVPDMKRMLLRSYGVPTVEVDMKDTYRTEVSDEQIVDAIFGDHSWREWIVRPGDLQVPVPVVGPVDRGAPQVSGVLKLLTFLGASLRYLVGLPAVSTVRNAAEVIPTPDQKERETILEFNLRQLDLAPLIGTSSQDGGLVNPRGGRKTRGGGKGRVPASSLPCLFFSQGEVIQRSIKCNVEKDVAIERRAAA